MEEGEMKPAGATPAAHRTLSGAGRHCRPCGRQSVGGSVGRVGQEDCPTSGSGAALRRLASFGFVLVLLLAGCGGDNKVSSTPAPDKANDSRRVETEYFAYDIPADWTAASVRRSMTKDDPRVIAEATG